MVHNLTNQNPIPHHTLQLLRQRTLPIIVLLTPARQIDINRGALAGKDLGAEAVGAEIDGGAVDLVEHDGGQRAEHLQREGRAFDDVDGRDKRVDDEGDAGAVVERDGVCFVDDADGGFRAAGDEDRLVDGGFDFDQPFGRGVVVLDDPLVAVEFFPRRLFRSHVPWFGFWAGDRRFAPAGGRGGAVLGVGAGGHGSAGAEGGVFVCLRRGVDFAETGGDGFAFGELLEYTAHITGAGAGGGHSIGGGHGRWGRGAIERWKRWRWRRCGARRVCIMDRWRFRRGLARLDLAKSFLGFNAIVVPNYPLRVVLPNVRREGL